MRRAGALSPPVESDVNFSGPLFRERVQNASAPTTSPPARVESACQIPGGGRLVHPSHGLPAAPAGRPVRGSKGHDWTESVMKRTDPSPIRASSPPGCMLDAELAQAAIALATTRSQALGG